MDADILVSLEDRASSTDDYIQKCALIAAPVSRSLLYFLPDDPWISHALNFALPARWMSRWWGTTSGNRGLAANMLADQADTGDDTISGYSRFSISQSAHQRGSHQSRERLHRGEGSQPHASLIESWQLPESAIVLAPTQKNGVRIA